MRHAGANHAALEQVPVPAWLLTAATVWDRVASAEYLVEQLPGLLRSHGPPGRAGHGMVAAETGAAPSARTGERYRAVLSVMDSWPQLQGHVSMRR